MDTHPDFPCSIMSPPPFSPRAPPPDPNRSTTDLLEALCAFYQQEIMWVCRTKAALALAGVSDTTAATDESSSAPSSSLPTITTETSPDGVAATVKPAIDTRWSRRKETFELRLNGFPKGVSPPTIEVSEAGSHILDLFERMMEARMESCLRMNRLVRSIDIDSG